jgi:hypothetical protein
MRRKEMVTNIVESLCSKLDYQIRNDKDPSLTQLRYPLDKQRIGHHIADPSRVGEVISAVMDELQKRFPDSTFVLDPLETYILMSW